MPSHFTKNKATPKWKDMYADLVKFRENHPGRWPIRNGIEFKLAQLRSTQRFEYNKQKLPNSSIAKLNKIDFPWKCTKKWLFI